MLILIIGNDGRQARKFIVSYTKTHIAQIKKIVPSAKIVLTDNDQVINRTLAEADILIHPTGGYPFDKLPIDQAKNLKWVQTTSAGVTDIAVRLKNTKILLTNASGVHPIPISEHVAGYMLMFARRSTETYKNQVVNKKWTRNFTDLQCFELNGKTVGIVGFGKIGGQVAKISKGLGMKVAVLAHTKRISDRSIRVYKNIDNLLANSDFVVDCLPLTSETKGFFDLKKFKFMLHDSYFINIGRGGTVVERDLVKALRANIIAGAALDVFEVEPLPDSSPLWDLPNVILTPHISGWTPEYTNRVVEIFCKNLKAYLANKPIPTLVDKSRGY